MYNKLLYAAVGASLEAGAEIMRIYESPDSDFEVEAKADNSPLTKADRRSHSVIAARLAPLGIPVLSEEGKSVAYAERKAWSRLWIVDPLDGTKEFIKRNGEFTVNIALVEDGVPTLGVIYVPVKRTLYFAAKNVGAYKIENVGERNLPAQADLLRDARRLPSEGGKRNFTVVASRSHLSPETQAFIDNCRAQHPDLETKSSGSSLKICLVAEGAADVYPRFAPTMEWDTAAGHAIALAAGCRMRRPETGVELVYNKENLLNPWFVVEKK